MKSQKGYLHKWIRLGNFMINRTIYNIVVYRCYKCNKFSSGKTPLKYITKCPHCKKDWQSI